MTRYLVAAASLCLFASVGTFANVTHAQNIGDQIANSPDAYAWKLFIEINHPASARRGEKDPTKKIGDPGKVVWETWKNARNEIFDGCGRKPPAWDEAEPAPSVADSRQSFKFEDLVSGVIGQSSVRRATDGIRPRFDPISSPNGINETRLNRAAFEFIVDNELYNLDGQEAFLKPTDGAPFRKVDFPIAAREIKAQWKELTASDDATKYHTATAGGKTYGLTGLHITTKDLPNWFWTTFEHRSNPPPEFPDFDRIGLPTELKGTKWENYRLRGTQIDFVEGTGRPTILANTQMEGGFQQSSSCITCHARATIGSRLDNLLAAGNIPIYPANSAVLPYGRVTGSGANRLTVFANMDTLKLFPADPDPKKREAEAVYISGFVGAPITDHFVQLGFQASPRYLQLDFVFALSRAQRKKGGCGPAFTARIANPH